MVWTVPQQTRSRVPLAEVLHRRAQNLTRFGVHVHALAWMRVAAPHAAALAAAPCPSSRVRAAVRRSMPLSANGVAPCLPPPGA
jgi:hypothetical protein